MPSGSSDSVVVKSIEKAVVREAMDAYAARLLLRPEVEEIVVFGSFERDTYAPGSDLDVLVVLCESSLPIRDRPGEYRPVRFPVPLDLFALTRSELETRQDSPMTQALEKSRWRYRREF
jgi:predicted nucleotidyltransferase